MIDSPAAGSLTSQYRVAPPARPTAEPDLEVAWASTWAEVREAQRLRYRVFAGEMGARLPTGRHGLDADEFDAHCDHLLVRDGADGPVVGTYRVLLPDPARAAGRLYSEQEFDIAALDPLRPRLAELGRACVDVRFRQGGVILALWGALAGYLAEREIDWLLGCCSVPLQPSVQGAAALCRQLFDSHAAAATRRVRPLLPLPMEGAERVEPAEPPSLLKAYLRIGARVLGAPAWDSTFGCADLPLLLHRADLPARFQRRSAAPACAA